MGKLVKMMQWEAIEVQICAVGKAITGDFGLIKAWKADSSGNLIFWKAAWNFNVPMDNAAKCTIAEVSERQMSCDGHMTITGGADSGEGTFVAENIHLPHVYVDGVAMRRELK